MNDFNVRLNLIECFTDECGCKHIYEREVTVTSVNQTINLFNNYTLNIVRVTDTYFTVLIQNGVNVLIRNIYTTYPQTCVLPGTNCRQTITCSGDILET